MCTYVDRHLFFYDFLFYANDTVITFASLHSPFLNKFPDPFFPFPPLIKRPSACLFVDENRVIVRRCGEVFGA